MEPMLPDEGIKDLEDLAFDLIHKGGWLEMWRLIKSG